jgi:hypothetical protein
MNKITSWYNVIIAEESLMKLLILDTFLFARKKIWINKWNKEIIKLIWKKPLKTKKWWEVVEDIENLFFFFQKNI